MIKIEKKTNTLNKPFKDIDYAKFASYCNQNNLAIKDKGKYIEGIKCEITLEELKQYKKDNLKTSVENYFYTNYPLYKQNNIAIFGSDEEKDNFKNFHDTIVSKYDEIVHNINNSQNKGELENIDIEIKIN